MSTDMKAQRDYTKREYGTRNLKKSAKVEALEQGQEARKRAEHAARAADPRVAARRAKRVARQEHRQAKQVNIVGRPGQDQAAMQAAARDAAAVGQQPGTSNLAEAAALVNQAATSRAEADKQALGALEYGGQPTFAEKLGQDLVAQGTSNLVETATGVPGALAEEGAGAVKQAGILSAPLAMGS